jgi:dipeptidyl aminopeptidase/acylaminoacyl peptidase
VVEAFLDSPAGAPDGPLPTVLAIHGGPAAMWAFAPSLESLLLAGRGYRVVRPNIAGSTGYGRAHGDALVGAWGTRGGADCHAVLDDLVAAGLADGDRLAVVGLSFGGYLASWLANTSDRFRAAVSENGVVNLVSMLGTSDIGRWIDSGSALGDPVRPADVARLWAQSPLAHVAGSTTPMLLLQGDADLRCPPSEAEQLHTALLRLGREVELVRYPGESHMLQFTGRPDRRIDRHRRVLAFLDRHLRGAA